MLRFLLPVVCALAALPSISNAVASDATYLLSPGDNLTVSVWGEDKLKQDVRVLPDGSITFPLAGQVNVAGLDATAVAKQIATKLEAFIPDPQVSVVVTGTEGNLVYVQGKVLKPGTVHMSGQTSVLQVLSMAGGLDKFADKDDIKVVRLNGTKQQILRVDYSKLMSGDDMTTNFLLKAGDTLVVP
ncbi:polysaccharide biosynthesis/export family protein [Pseudomonas sp. 14P_8.1_Bac3]|uniref:polysaccharide biosynthesis/export family protein n=1 Tax=Pseudomonas sp. 14P_8.1_Bac3 TaxID=2971621 RepID=UPI0021CA7D53|nr:polysaccharide biosynthesis/export family protein [Pseudomonas sp. 14P_8.1_Bac3]MCU1761120.1 polysaccharide biosynthesis/export family protein [Pseudomonas sp. 14P_8.1_Bac3]